MRLIFWSSVFVLAGGSIALGADGPYYRVTIDSVPAGAKVYVDGKQEGMACQAGPNCKPRMSRGTHSVILELDGYKAIEEAINVAGNQRFVFTMKTAGSRVEVRASSGASSTTRGADILIDGRPSGTVPSEIDVSPGRHTVEVKRQGYYSYLEEFDIKATESRQVTVSLAEIPPPAPAVRYIQPPPPLPPPPIGSKVSFVPRDGDTGYIITSSSGQTCSTPCSMLINPGHALIGVNGPGSKHFEKQIVVPQGPSQVTVQHFTLSRVIAGPILTVLGIPFLAAGANFLYYYGNGYGQDNGVAAAVLGIHGLAFTISGLVQLGTIKTNRAEVRRMSPSSLPQSYEYPE
jgi:hypothetical protein